MYTTLIITDDETSVAGLPALIRHLPLQLTGIAGSIADGIKLLRRTDPDIVFLDMNAASTAGLDFLETADKRHRYFIFMTAHKSFALEAVRKNINDYLLKPVLPGELKHVIEKAVRYFGKPRTEHPADARVNISIPTSKGTIFKNITDIMYIQAKSRYAEVICKDGSTHLVCKNIGEYEDELAGRKFFRVHKSYLVNCAHVLSVDNGGKGFIEMPGGLKITIARRKKTNFIRFMQP
jgi:two-component system LytT family response regulator